MYILLDTACSTNVESGECLINHIKKNRTGTLHTLCVCSRANGPPLLSRKHAK